MHAPMDITANVDGVDYRTVRSYTGSSFACCVEKLGYEACFSVLIESYNAKHDDSSSQTPCLVYSGRPPGPSF